jgi:hypothetical protein
MGDIIKPTHGPEWYIQQDLIEYLVNREWVVEVMHGNAFQRGIPDLWLWNERLEIARWVDVKNPKKYSFTKAQKIKWPAWESRGIGIWILVAATQEEYDKLFEPPNWRKYWKDSWALPTQEEIDDLLDLCKEDDECDLFDF